MKRRSAIFIHIPKTAGSSVERALKPHRDLREILVRRTNKTFQSLRLSFRLNGIDTQTHASARDYSALLGDGFYDYFSFAFVRNPFDWAVSHYHFSLKRGKTNLSFRDYLENMTANSQADYITDNDGNVMISFVGRFERLNEDFSTVSEKIGLRLNLPHLNSTTHEGFASHYDPITREIVVDRYRRDFEVLGYSTDLAV
nr:sulfotransferase family 2 domain-containing protein [Phaeovulum sp. NW3]